MLRRLRRATLAVFRREVEPVDQAVLGRFLPTWHGVGRRSTLREAIVPLQGLPLPVALWESDVLPRRVPGYQPSQLDALCASGEVVWVGAGLDRVALYFRDDAAALGPPEAPRSGGEAAAAVRAALHGGALFWSDLVAATGLDPADALAVLWELVWAGEVTNDAWTPLRAPRRYELPRPDPRRRFSRSRARGNRRAGSLVAGRRIVRRRAGPPGACRAAARAARHRDARRRARRGHPRRLRCGLRRASCAGDDRGLSTWLLRRRARGAQFAPPGAVERLRELRDSTGDAVVLAAARPAQPYGAALPWPKRAAARAARVAGAQVVLLDGEQRCSWSAAGARSSRSATPTSRGCATRWTRSSPLCVQAARLAVERFDGEPVVESAYLPLLVESGFLVGRGVPCCVPDGAMNGSRRSDLLPEVNRL